MNVLLKRLAALLLVLPFAATAQAECVEQSGSGEEVMGTLLGAALGGLVGAQIGGGTGRKVAIAAGVIGGGYLGNRIGRRLSCKDQEYHIDTTQSALEYKPTGSTAAWVNPDTGHSGAITPTETFVATDGTPCRNFTQVIEAGGEYEEVQATACRQPDGSWRIVDS
jgi:surface antigen